MTRPARPASAANPSTISRRSLLAIGGGGLLAGLAGCGGDEPVSSGPLFVGTPAAGPVPAGEPGRWRGRTVRVATFGGEVGAALRRLVWEPFARATGCTVSAIGVGGPDLFSTPEANAGPDLTLLDPVTASQATDGIAFDPAAAPAGVDLPSTGPIATLPAFAYALVNARRRGAFPDGTEPVGWSAWWDTATHPAARTLGRDPLGTLEIALMADGVAADALYPLDVDRALAALGRVAPTVGDRWWTRGIEPVGWIGSGKADLGSAWHHRVIGAQWDGLGVELSWPGGLLAVDHWQVPAAAREPEIAAELALFALDAQVQAAFARETRMGPTNRDAFAFIEPWLRPTMPTDPDLAAALVPLDGAWWAGFGQDARVRFDRWFAARPLA